MQHLKVSPSHLDWITSNFGTFIHWQLFLAYILEYSLNDFSLVSLSQQNCSFKQQSPSEFDLEILVDTPK